MSINCYINIVLLCYWYCHLYNANLFLLSNMCNVPVFYVSVTVTVTVSVHCFKPISADFVGAENLFRWSSTTCGKNCFCSSLRVKALLNSCIKATPCSARSLTTFTDWAIFWLVLYVSWCPHSLGSGINGLLQFLLVSVHHGGQYQTGHQGCPEISAD